MDIMPIGNETTITIVGNEIEIALFDVYTDSLYISQFQTIDEHKEVNHGDNN